MLGGQIAVATGAGILLMRRSGEERCIHEYGTDDARRIGGSQGLVTMTLQAISIGQRLGRQQDNPRKPKKDGNNVNNKSPTCRHCDSLYIGMQDHTRLADERIFGRVD